MSVKKDDLKNFQLRAIKSLSEQFSYLWKSRNRRINIVFNAPTGSGKTIMMAEMIKSFDSDYNFDEDKCYIWISFGDDTSCKQSKNKFIEYFGEDNSYMFKDKKDLYNDDCLQKNNILFINWSSIKASDSEGKLLRRDDEDSQTGGAIFDSYIDRTKSEREIVLIIDEAHIESDTELADDILDLLDPKIIFRVTATPKYVPSADDMQNDKAGYYGVKESDVIESGLIKEKLITQTAEDIELLKKKYPKKSLEQIIIILANEKRKLLKKIYSENNIEINPLVLIQLPNDYKDKEDVKEDLKTIVKNELCELKVDIDEKVAIWLNNEKEDEKLKDITNLNNEIEFMVFKVAPATGWDCPRASILVMFREIKKPAFKQQILGRIKRMPFGNKFENLPDLNYGYVYTNYSKKDIIDVTKPNNPNKPEVYYCQLKNGIKQIDLKGDLKVRTGYNTITPPQKWQEIFFHKADMFFGTSEKSIKNNLNCINNKMKLEEISIKNSVITDVNVDSFDNFITELKKLANESEYELSDYQIEKLYNLFCFDLLKNQKEEAVKYNVARSWRTLKASINAWFISRTGISSSDKMYKIFVNDLQNNNSCIKGIVYQSLVEFRQYVTNKTEFQIKENNIKLPLIEDSFTDDYELLKDVDKCAYDNFYIFKNYRGKENEIKFIDYIDSNKNVVWWIKQANSGSNVFGCRYTDNSTNPPTESIFYPDFIVKTKSKLYFLDSKSGFTSSSSNTIDKCRDLQEWIRNNSNKYNFEIIGGIVKDFGNGIWKINKSKLYNNNDESQWKELQFN